MGHYDCSRCGGSPSSCDCYHHRRTYREEAASKAAIDVYRKAKDHLEDFMRGWAWPKDIEGKKIFDSKRKIPVFTLDMEYLHELRKEYLRLNEEYSRIHEEEYEKGKARHDSRV